jgi:Flp pilus assembly protein TadG
VELVLVLPIVILGLLLVLQVAMVARAQLLVVHAAREGARAAAVEGTQEAAGRAAARSLPADRLAVDAQIDRRPGGLAVVTVRYRCPTDVPLIGPLVGDRVLEAEVAMLVEAPSLPDGVPGSSATGS